MWGALPTQAFGPLLLKFQMIRSMACEMAKQRAEVRAETADLPAEAVAMAQLMRYQDASKLSPQYAS